MKRNAIERFSAAEHNRQVARFWLTVLKEATTGLAWAACMVIWFIILWGVMG